MNVDNKSLSGRIDWIDFAKGITILLVIIGHTVNGWIRGTIFSFHMPLFFILSCATFKYSKSEEQFKKATIKGFKHLIIPAILMFFICIMISIVKNPSSVANLELLKEYSKIELLSLLFASGIDVCFFDTRIPCIGIPWFLFVLFEGRTLLDYLNLKLSSKKLIFYSLLFSIVGVILGKMVLTPFSFDIALAIFPLLLFGKNFRALCIEEKAGVKLLFSFVLWAVCLLITYRISYSYMELACRRYTLYPFCFIIALLGTIMISELGVLCCRTFPVTKFIVYLGKNSLYMLCIHILDYYLWQWTFSWAKYEVLNAITRVSVDLLVFVVFMLIKGIFERNIRVKQNIVVDGVDKEFIISDNQKSSDNFFM